MAEVCQFINRGISPSYLEDGGVAVLNQKCIRGHTVNLDLGRRHDATVKTVTPARLVRAGDVLVNSTGTGTLGRVAQLREDPPEPTTVDSHVTIVRPTEGLFYPPFFGYALVAIEKQIQEGGEGCGGQTELSRTKLAENYYVSFPPDLHDQRRIAAILDDAFERIATAKSNTERILQNARKVFDIHRRSIFSGDGEKWPRKPLGEFTKVQSGGTPLISDKSFWGGDIAWYSSGELNDLYTSDPERHITEAGLNGSNAKLFPKGSLLVGMYDTAALKMSLLDRDAAFNQAIAGIKPNAVFEPEFVMHSINVDRETILSLRRGVRQKNLSLGKIKEIEVPIPVLDEQQKVVARLAETRNMASRLEESYRFKAIALDELKNSLLHQAFTGALTSKNTDKQVAEVA